MGGEATEISEKSSRVVLEAAVFNGKSIRKTSGRLNLRSESSSRFEKGINVATVNEALDAAASMIAELQVQRCVRASFQQASWILLMWKFLQPLQT